MHVRQYKFAHRIMGISISVQVNTIFDNSIVIDTRLHFTSKKTNDHTLKVKCVISESYLLELGKDTESKLRKYVQGPGPHEDVNKRKSHLKLQS